MSSVQVRLPLPGPLVKRLRHRPFTAVTWVRFPYGSPKNNTPAFAGVLFFGDSHGIEETGRAKRGKKQSGGLFLRSGEIPFISERSRYGCEME